MEGSLQQSIADALLAYTGLEAGLAAAPPLLLRAEELLRETADIPACTAAVHAEQMLQQEQQAEDKEPQQHTSQRQQPRSKQQKQLQPSREGLHAQPDAVGGALGLNPTCKKQGTKRKAERDPSPEPPATLFVGISRCHEGWRAKLKPSKRLAGKDRALGTFSTREEAARAYDRGMLVVQLQHNDRVHAILNFPLDEYLGDPDPEVAAAAATVKARIDERQAQRAAWRALQQRQQAQQPGEPPAAGGILLEQGGLVRQEPKQKRKQQTRREQMFQLPSPKPESACGKAAAGQHAKPAEAVKRPAALKEPAVGRGKQKVSGETITTTASQGDYRASFRPQQAVAHREEAAAEAAVAGPDGCNLQQDQRQQQRTAEQHSEQRHDWLGPGEALPTSSLKLPQQQHRHSQQQQVHSHVKRNAPHEALRQQRLPPVQLSSPRPLPLLACYGLASPAGVSAQRQPVSPLGPADTTIGPSAKVGSREHGAVALDMPEHSAAGGIRKKEQQQPVGKATLLGREQDQQHQPAGKYCVGSEQVRRARAPPQPQAPRPESLGQDSWRHAAQAWRQKHMPTAHELLRAQQGQAGPVHAEATARSAASGQQRGSRASRQPGKGGQPWADVSAGTSRKAKGQGPQKQEQQQQQPVGPWRLLSMSLPASQVPQKGRQGWFREHHQRRVAGCVAFDAVLQAFGVACDASNLREAYRQAVRRFHPDSNSRERLWATPDQREECEEILKIINQRKPAVL
ncbi:hypothetical protein N2152v2_009295 [Parachlorella kessleri]